MLIASVKTHQLNATKFQMMNEQQKQKLHQEKILIIATSTEKNWLLSVTLTLSMKSVFVKVVDEISIFFDSLSRLILE